MSKRELPWDGANGEGGWQPGDDSESWKTEKEVARKPAASLKNVYDSSFQFRGALYAAIAGMGLFSGGIFFIGKLCENRDQENIMSACKVDPSLGATHYFSKTRPNGSSFPHATLETATKPPVHFVAYQGEDDRGPIMIFEDPNNDAILNGREVPHGFNSINEARAYLERRVREINVKRESSMGRKRQN